MVRAARREGGFFGRTIHEALQRRTNELTAGRAGVISAVDAERQRIERDLHDGLQQRLVALGMLLGRARRSRDPDRARELLAQAHEDTQRAIDDLRQVAWRVYPSAPDHSTLDEVLAIVAQRSTTLIKIIYQLPVRPPRPVETVLYFVACEAITNATKHARTTVIAIEITAQGTGVQMLVHDDGIGGAEPGYRPGRPDRGRQPTRRPHHHPGSTAVRVVFAEDSTLPREGLVRLLADEGHQVVAAVADADRLVTVAEQHQPDVVITDVRVPLTNTDDDSGQPWKAAAGQVQGYYLVPVRREALRGPTALPTDPKVSATSSKTASPKLTISSTRLNASPRVPLHWTRGCPATHVRHQPHRCARQPHAAGA